MKKIIVMSLLCLSACVSTKTQTTQSILDVDQFLDKLAVLPDAKTGQIDRALLGGFGIDLEEITETTTVFTKITANPQNAGVTAISYQRRNSVEAVIFTLQPVNMCIDTKTLYSGWKDRMQAGTLSEIKFGAGKLWPNDGVHKNQEEKKRRGNGPIEMVVEVLNSKNGAQKITYTFEHEYHRCARSIVLKTWFERSGG